MGLNKLNIILIKPLLITMVLVSPINCFAYFPAQGTIGSIMAINQKIVFSVCNSTDCYKFWLEPDTDYNRVVVSLLVTAKVSESTVWVQGDDQLDEQWPYNGARKLNAFQLKDS